MMPDSHIECAIGDFVGHHVLHGDDPRRQLVAGAHHHAIARGIGGDDVQRVGGGDAKPLALAHRVAPVTVVRAQHGAVGAHDLPRLGREPLALEEGRVPAHTHEAHVLTLHRVGGRQAPGRGQRTHVILGHVAERQQQALEHVTGEAREHVALILGAVRGGGQHRGASRAFDPRVVAGGQPMRPEHRRRLGENAKAHLPVARDARIGRAPVAVAGDEVLHHLGPEALGGVDDQMRDPERGTRLPRKPHRLGRAARPLGAGRDGVVPQPHGHPHHVVPLINQQQGGHRAVNATAHGNGNALPRRCQTPPGVWHRVWRVLPHAGAEPFLQRPGDGVGHHVDAVAALRTQTAQIGVQRRG